MANWLREQFCNLVYFYWFLCSINLLKKKKKNIKLTLSFGKNWNSLITAEISRIMINFHIFDSLSRYIIHKVWFHTILQKTTGGNLQPCLAYSLNTFEVCTLYTEEWHILYNPKLLKCIHVLKTEVRNNISIAIICYMWDCKIYYMAHH